TFNNNFAEASKHLSNKSINSQHSHSNSPAFNNDFGDLGKLLTQQLATTHVRSTSSVDDLATALSPASYARPSSQPSTKTLMYQQKQPKSNAISNLPSAVPSSLVSSG